MCLSPVIKSFIPPISSSAMLEETIRLMFRPMPMKSSKPSFCFINVPLKDKANTENKTSLCETISASSTFSITTLTSLIL